MPVHCQCIRPLACPPVGVHLAQDISHARPLAIVLVHRVADDVSGMASTDKLGNLVPKNLPEGVLRLHPPALDRREVFGGFFPAEPNSHSFQSS